MHAGMICAGAAAIAVLGLLLWPVIKFAGLLPLLPDGTASPDRVSAYISLIGISFSVTFITTSLFGGLSDKSEKIYWRSYPEQYLINTPLNFMVLTGISFLSLAVQVVLTFFIRGDEVLREALFLSAFLIGIAAIVVLSYKFTAAFFSRRRFLAHAEAYFDGLIADPEKSEELDQAVVGLFNNTIEAAGSDGCDIGRVRENVELLLRHDSHPACSWWLEQLTVELGRSNLSGLIQLVSLLNDSPLRDRFTELLERVGARRNLPFDCQEVLIQAYKTRFLRLNDELGKDPGFFDDGVVYPEKAARWGEAGQEISVLFRKIRTDSYDNCCFVMEQFGRMPYDLLKQNACYDVTVRKWEDALEQLALCVREKDALAYQRLQKLMFDFLCRHPSFCYHDSLIDYQYTRDQMGERLNGMTAECVERLSAGELPYMIDTIEEENGRKAFLLWLAGQMVQRKLPADFWNVSRLSEYSGRGKHAYSEECTGYLIEKLQEMSDRLAEEYASRDRKGTEERYSCNLPLLEYRDFLRETTELLARVRGCENEGPSSLGRFLEAAFRRVSVGEANRFTEMVFDPFSETGRSPEDVVINNYTLVFETLVRVLDSGGEDIRKEEYGRTPPGAGTAGTEPVLKDLQQAIELTRDGTPRNYYPEEEEKSQKRSEFLFFLGTLLKYAEDRAIGGARLRGVAGVMARVLANPCLAPLTGDPERDPEEAGRCLAWFRRHPEARSEAADYVDSVFFETDVYPSLISQLRSRGGLDPQKAARFEQCAAEYESALLFLKKYLEL